MKVSVSFLTKINELEKTILKLENSSTDFIHLDIMDGKFVPNKIGEIEQYQNIFSNIKKALDVHLMVENIEEYVNEYAKLKPQYITFHYEATKNIEETIKMIHSLGCKCGISIKPNTPVSVLAPYLKKIDLVLVMSVEPGKGGQKFINESISKIEELIRVRTENKYHYLIEVDGGINEYTSKLCFQADILVSGSYIFKDSNIEDRINQLKKI